MIKKPSFLSVVIFVTALLGTNAHAEDKSLRERLIDSSKVSSLYSIDEHYTFLTAPDPKALESELKTACAESGNEAEADGQTVKCKDTFEASPSENIGAANQDKGYLVKHTSNEPFTYKSPSMPSYAEITKPQNGALQSKLTGADLFEYMSALCQKENGQPSFVVPKRYGKFVRLTQVGAVEAFSYITTAAEGKEAWFLACDVKKFVIEKSYRFKEGDNQYTFRANAGLDGVNYIKTADAAPYTPNTNEKVSGDFLQEMAREVAALKMNFVKVIAGFKFTGSYKNTSNSGCDIVSIKQQKTDTKVAEAEKVYNYKVCRDRVANLNSDDDTILSRLQDIYAFQADEIEN